MEPKTFVGREVELQQLENCLNKVINNKKGNTIFLTGEAGIGKTELIKQFKKKIQSEYPKVRFATGYCNELTGRGDPYLPFFTILDELLITEKEKGTNRFVKFILDMGPEWIKLIPGFGVPISVSLETAQRAKKEFFSSKSVVDKEKIDRDNIFRQYTKFIQNISNLNPIVLFIEDLQWADVSSVDLLFYFARNIDSYSILLIGTYRPSEVEIKQHPIKEIKAEMDRYKICQEIPLKGLKNLSLYLKTEFPNNAFDADFVDFLYDKTEGNPLFIAEIINLLKEQGILAPKNDLWQITERVADIDIPPTIKEVINKRIGYLRDEIKRVLKYASIEGERFSSVTLSKLLEWEELTLLEELEVLEKIHRLIEKLETEGILKKKGMLYQFAHSLMHKSFYDSLNVRQKQILHKKIGEILEAEYQDNVDEIVTQLAVHFEKGEEFGKAVKYRLMSAKKANNLYCKEEAVEHCNKGLSFLNKLEEGKENSEKRIDLFIELGKARELNNDWDNAWKDYEKGEELAKKIDDQKRISDIYYGYGRITYKKGEYERSIGFLNKSLEIKKNLKDKLGISYLLELIGINYINFQNRFFDAMVNLELSFMIKDEISDELGKACLLQRIGSVYYKLDRNDEAIANLERSLSIAKKYNNSYVQALSLSSIGGIHLVRGEWKKALNDYHESLKHLEKIGGMFTTKIDVLLAMGHCYFEGEGDVNSALKYYETALALSEEIRSLNGIAWAHTNIGKIKKEKNDLEQAELHLNKGLESYQHIKDDLGISFTLDHIGEIYLIKGVYDEAEKYLKEALDIQTGKGTQRDSGNTMIILSKLYLAKKEYDKALIYIDLAVPMCKGLYSVLAKLTKSKIYLAKGEYQKAKEFNTWSYSECKKLNLQHRLAESQMVKGMIKFLENEDKEALKLIEDAKKVFQAKGLKLLVKEAEKAIKELNLG